jgi:hypothetical protein
MIARRRVFQRKNKGDSGDSGDASLPSSPSPLSRLFFFVIDGVLAVTLLLGAGRSASAQTMTPPAAAQNPSPMVEHSRAHERIAQRELPGLRATFNGPLGKPVSIFIPESARQAKAVRLVVHFHGAAFLPEYAATQAGKDYVTAVLQLGSGNGVYDASFSNPAVFDTLVAGIQASINDVLQRNVAFRVIILSGFSAGHGAIRAILRDSADFTKIDGILLLDGMHTSYEPAGTVVALGGQLDPSKLGELVSYARAAMAGQKRLLITHSEIFPGTFASTTETANYLLEKVGVARRPVLKWGPLGMQQTSEAERGRLRVLGFAGNSGPDHIDHFHAMYHFLRQLERL